MMEYSRLALRMLDNPPPWFDAQIHKQVLANWRVRVQCRAVCYARDDPRQPELCRLWKLHGYIPDPRVSVMSLLIPLSLIYMVVTR